MSGTIYFSTQKKNGRWHMCANLTSAFTKDEIARWFNGYRQKVESCGLPRDADQSEALRILHDTQKGKDFKAKYMEYMGKKDPLLLEAQKFLESLYAKFDEKGQPLPEDQWWEKPPYNESDLESLRYHNKYPDDYNRMVSKLRNLMFQFDEFGGIRETPDIDTELKLLEHLKEDESRSGLMAMSKDRVLDQIYSKFDEFEKPHFSHWAKVGVVKDYFRKMRSNERIKGTKTDKEWEEYEETMYKAQDLSQEDRDRYDLIHKAFRSFDYEETVKSKGKSTSGWTFKDAQESWLKSVERKGDVRKDTIHHYKQQQQIFLDKFGNRTLDAFNKRLLYQFCEYLQNERTKTPPTTKTIKNYKTGISVVLDHATKASKFDYEKNEWDGISVSSFGREGRRRGAWDTDLFRDLLSLDLNADNRFLKLVWKIALCTGCRLEEVAALRWRDIRTFEGVYSFDWTDDYYIVKEGGAVGEWVRRRVPVIDALKEAIDAYKPRVIPKDDRLFPVFQRHPLNDKYSNHASKRMLYYIKKIRPISEKIMMDNHSMRQTFVQICTSYEIEDSMVRKLTGQQQQDTFKNYNWEAPRNFKRLYERLNEIDDFNLIKGDE